MDSGEEETVFFSVGEEMVWERLRDKNDGKMW